MKDSDRKNRVAQFFDDYFNIEKMIQSKREYKAMMARVDQLPKDYKYVYKKIQNYMWCFAAAPGYDMIDIQDGLLDLFEQGAAEGKNVLEVTGPDVGDFVDELLKGAKTYQANWKEELNQDIQSKLRSS